MNWRTISRLLGSLLFIVGLAMSTSLIWSIADKDQQGLSVFGLSVGITLFASLILLFIGKSRQETIYIREALFVVASGWVLISLFGALPYFLSGTFASYIDCLFETVSGFTTTGSSVMSFPENLSKALLYWRGLTHWLGGMGIIVLYIAILPHLGTGGRRLFDSEVAGPITSSFRPKLKETALILWQIYITFTFLEVVALIFCGMNFHDALCHSFATLATGGFSTKSNSIQHYNSPAIEMVITFFMFAAGTNFYLYYLAAKGKLKSFLKDTEFKVFASILIIASIVITISILPRHHDFFQALRYGAFQAVSIGTCTGFSTDDFNLYPAFSKALLLILMIIGGSAGSTAGGIKVARFVVFVKKAKEELLRASRPHTVRAIKLGEHVVPKQIVGEISVFVGMYFSIIAVGTLFMTATGLDIVSAVSAVSATLGGVGPGLEKVGPMTNFASVHPAGKLFLSLCMIMGRLEIITILALFIPSFWRR